MSLADSFSTFQQNINQFAAFVGGRLRSFSSIAVQEKIGYIVFGVGLLLFLGGLVLSIL